MKKLTFKNRDNCFFFKFDFINTVEKKLCLIIEVFFVLNNVLVKFKIFSKVKYQRNVQGRLNHFPL